MQAHARGGARLVLHVRPLDGVLLAVLEACRRHGTLLKSLVPPGLMTAQGTRRAQARSTRPGLLVKPNSWEYVYVIPHDDLEAPRLGPKQGTRRAQARSTRPGLLHVRTADRENV